MSERTITHAKHGSVIASGDLCELFKKYRAFVKRLGEVRGRPYFEEDHCCFDYDEFRNWWGALKPDLQSLYQKDFDNGYDAALQDAEIEVRAVLEKYRQTL